MEFRSKVREEAQFVTGTNAVRGAIVLAAAVIVGAVTFSRLDSSGPIAVAAGTTTEAVDTVVDPAAPLATDGTTDSLDPGIADSGSVGATGQDAASSSVPASTTGDTTASSETTPGAAPVVRPPAQVTVYVLNGAEEEQGIAAKGTAKATAAGYKTLVAQNAFVVQPSVIYFRAGFELEGQAVADVFGPDLRSLVKPLDPANPPGDDVAKADVIVVLGDDGVIPVT